MKKFTILKSQDIITVTTPVKLIKEHVITNMFLQHFVYVHEDNICPASYLCLTDLCIVHVG